MATTMNKIYKFVGEEKIGSVDSSTSFPGNLEEECHELKSSEIREGTGFNSYLISKMNLIGILNFVFFLRKYINLFFDVLFLIWLAFSNNLEEQCKELLKSLILTSFDSVKYHLCIFICLEFQFLLRLTASVFFYVYHYEKS